MSLIMYGILFFAGIFIGFYASNVGGGALVSIPLLILTGLPTTIAIGTNRISAAVLELTSAIRYHKEKKYPIRISVMLGVVAAAGSIIGSQAVNVINARLLNVIVAAALFLVLIFFLFRDRLGIRQREVKRKHLLMIAPGVFLLGIYGGFFGAGFGTFIMIALMIAGYNLLHSAALARVIGFMMSTTSTIIFALHGTINYWFALALSSGYAIGAWFGAGVAIKKGEGWIKVLLIIIVIATIIKLGIDIFGIKVF